MNKFMEIVRKWRDAPDLTDEEKIAFIRAELETLDATHDILEVMIIHLN
jgi:hypothetical protein